MVRKKKLRNFDRIQEDCLWPQRGLCPDPLENLRYQALEQVLCTLPEKDYRILSENAETLDWFIPFKGSYGECHPFVANVRDPKILGLRNYSFKTADGKRKRGTIAPHARVLYLSPELERIAWDRILVVVAHELAHVILGHPLYSGGEYDKNENEAWTLVRKWGFANEVRKHFAFRKRAETFEEKRIQKLSKLMKEGKDVPRKLTVR